MCARCWHLVPTPVQREVNRTWREFNVPRKPTEKLQRLRQYRCARDAAVAAAQQEVFPPTALNNLEKQ